MASLFFIGSMEKFQNEQHFRELCDWVVDRDSRFQPVIEAFGYPPLWYRPPDFSTLVLTILEQQVSLAAARSMFNRLVQRVESLTPQNLLQLDEDGLRECGLSRQKSRYVRNVADEIVSGNLDMETLNTWNESQIRERLIQIKGIGHWTVDMYVLMSLLFGDIFPPGDLATIKATYELELVEPSDGKNEIILFMKQFEPWRSAATYLLWHYYLEKRSLSL